MQTGNPAQLGWGEYVDGTYTAASPDSLVADTPKQLIIDTTVGLGYTHEDQLPRDISTFWDHANNVIPGLVGDAYLISIQFKAKPTEVACSYLEWWLEIGGVHHFERILSFPKGAGVERNITFTTMAHVHANWGDGASMWISAPGTADIYDKEVLISRLHAGRP